jgi:small GTP-binding protein
MGDSFVTNHLPTIGTDFAVKELIAEGLKISFQIWDIAGQAAFSSVRKRFYDNTSGVLLVFDLTNTKSFEDISIWLEEVLNVVQPPGTLQVLLVGNKRDLVDEGDETFSDSRMQVAISQMVAKYKLGSGAMTYITTSALTGENIQEAFLDISQRILSMT